MRWNLYALSKEADMSTRHLGGNLVFHLGDDGAGLRLRTELEPGTPDDAEVALTRNAS